MRCISYLWFFNSCGTITCLPTLSPRRRKNTIIINKYIIEIVSTRPPSNAIIPSVIVLRPVSALGGWSVYGRVS